MTEQENALVVLPPSEPDVRLGTLAASDPQVLVGQASAIAKTLAQVIDQQGLANTISGRSYVHVEGWTTLATMLGVMPREVANEQLEDGSYLATVELVRMRDGAVVTRASAECGMDEGAWANRPRYARRSMAATRATGKACRLAFSWIMALAGYEATPAEEIEGLGRQAEEPKAAPATGRKLTNQEARRALAAKPKSTPASTPGTERITEPQARRALAIASGRGGEVKVHGFRVVEGVLRDFDLPALPSKASSDDALLHLCEYVDRPAYDAFCDALTTWMPGAAERT